MTEETDRASGDRQDPKTWRPERKPSIEVYDRKNRATFDKHRIMQLLDDPDVQDRVRVAVRQSESRSREMLGLSDKG